MRGVKPVLAAVCVTALAALSACGSGGGGDAGAKAKPGANLTGPDVKVMTWSEWNTQAINYPGIPYAAQVAADYVNDHGGINGHRIVLETCNAQGDPNRAEQCARQAVSSKAVAVLGSFTQFGNRTVPVLEQAHIPMIGLTPLTAPEYTSEWSFPISGGSYANTAGEAQRAVDAGCKQVAVAQADNPAADAATNTFKLAAATHNLKVVGPIRLPLTATDFAPQVAQTRGSDCVAFVTAPGQVAIFLKSLAQSGEKPKLINFVGGIDDTVLNKTGGVAEGMLTDGWYPPTTSPLWKGYRDAIDTYAGSHKKDIALVSDQNSTAWLTFQIFQKVTKGLSAVTGDTVADALRRTTALDTGGLTPPLNWSKPGPISSIPRIVNATVFPGKVKDGKVVADGKEFIQVAPLLRDLR